MFRLSALGRRIAPQLARAASVRTMTTARTIHQGTSARWAAAGAIGAGALLCTPTVFASENQFTFVVACKEDEMQDGEMKEIAVGEEKIAVYKTGGKYYATSAKCSHYGAPMVSGTLSGTRVICPWHGAVFDVRNGKSVAAPGMDGLDSYQVIVRGGEVVVKVPKVKAAAGHCIPKQDLTKDSRQFVVVGGGAAGLACAENLRKEGFLGRIVLISDETTLPYDRPLLSKRFDKDINKTVLRSAEYLKDLDIEVRLGTPVVNINAEDQVVTLADYRTISYDSCFVATGARPRMPRVPGHQLANIFTLRGASENWRVCQALESKPKRAVVVGSSFIGMEAAAALKKAGVESVTVVGMESVPFERVLGAEVGAAVKHLHESNGVDFKMGRTVSEFKGLVGSVTKVVLDNGEEVAADIVIVGAGVVIDSSLVKGVAYDKNGGVRTNAFLRAAPNTYIGGDLCSFPDAYSGDHTRIEHWNVAQQHGRVAAKNMAGKPTPYDEVPFFWSNAHGKALRYVGNGQGYDEIVLEGNVSELKFVAYYLKGEQIIGAAGMNMPGNVIPAIGEAIRTNSMPTAKEVRLGVRKGEAVSETIANAVKAGCGRKGCCHAK